MLLLSLRLLLFVSVFLLPYYTRADTRTHTHIPQRWAGRKHWNNCWYANESSISTNMLRFIRIWAGTDSKGAALDNRSGKLNWISIRCIMFVLEGVRFACAYVCNVMPERIFISVSVSRCMSLCLRAVCERTQMEQVQAHNSTKKNSNDTNKVNRLTLDWFNSMWFISTQLKQEEADNEICRDWKFAAMVVDRLCLIIFTLFTLLATLFVLFSAPNFLL